MKSKPVFSTLLLALLALTANAQTIHWRTDYKSALAEAKRTKKLLVVDFYAKWCTGCVKLDKQTYTDKNVRAFMKNVIPLKLNVEVGNNQAIADQHHVLALPTVAVIDSQGHLKGSFLGFKDPKKFLSILQPIVKKSH